MRSRQHRVIRLLVTTAAAAALAGTVTTGTAVAAPAAATCSTSHTSSTGSARCTGTTQQYRVKVGCTDELRGNFVGYYYGPYVGSGQTSSKKCPFEGNVQTEATSAAVQFR